jgi:hypothetical protein
MSTKKVSRRKESQRRSGKTPKKKIDQACKLKLSEIISCWISGIISLIIIADLN